jgi:hypothetical protein
MDIVCERPVVDWVVVPCPAVTTIWPQLQVTPVNHSCAFQHLEKGVKL